MMDWAVHDAAEVLEISSGAVKARLHRARDAMRAFFEAKCNRLRPGNPCTCQSRVGVTLRFDPDLLKRAQARLAGRAPATARVEPRTILEIVRRIPELRLDPAARERFFAAVQRGRPGSVS